MFEYVEPWVLAKVREFAPAVRNSCQADGALVVDALAALMGADCTLRSLDGRFYFELPVERVAEQCALSAKKTGYILRSLGLIIRRESAGEYKGYYKVAWNAEQCEALHAYYQSLGYVEAEHG